VNEIPGLSQSLNPREEEILILISDGFTKRQIAGDGTLALSAMKWSTRPI
jgi:ATP/maltotriose-dependent transcriptional regulator MalT